ncbi:Deoxyuridine 5'-triphosphate nucleotidohydrolase, partial [Haemophilus influenzae]|jgi:hypothetical protein
MKKI